MGLADETRNQRLGEYLVAMRMLTEEQVYQALSLQSSLPFSHLDPRRIRPGVARAFPAHVLDTWRVLPFQVAGDFFSWHRRNRRPRNLPANWRGLLN